MPILRSPLAARALAAACVLAAVCWGGTAHSQTSSKGAPGDLKAVVKQYAGSHILGTGANHFVTSIRPVDENNAVAIVGEASSDGRDPNAYTVYAKRIKTKWKIVKYEFIFKPTGQRRSEDQVPPFPYPNWRKDAP